jgi:hypothetical protein
MRYPTLFLVTAESQFVKAFAFDHSTVVCERAFRPLTKGL